MRLGPEELLRRVTVAGGTCAERAALMEQSESAALRL